MAHTRAVLIVGGSGFIGTHLALRLRDQFKVFATHLKHRINIPGVTSVPLDVDNKDWSKRVAYTCKPDVVIYACGFNNVKWAEDNTKDAEFVHTSGAGTLTNAADIFQPKFIYLSNCHVFDGSRGNYHETDTVLPATALGKAKLGGENFVRGRSLNYVIVRSSPLIGRGNGLSLSFLDRLRMALDRGERVELSTNEVHSYAHISGLVDLIARVADSGIRNKILHFGGLTKVNSLEWGRAFAERFGYDPKLVMEAQIKVQAEEEKAKQQQEQPNKKKAFSAPDLGNRDYSLNSSLAIEMLKVKPLLMEQCFDLIEKDLVPPS